MIISNRNDVVVLCNKMKRGEIFKTHVSCLSCSFPLHEMPIKKESIIPKRDAWKMLCSSKKLLVPLGKNYYLLIKLSHHTTQNILSYLWKEWSVGWEKNIFRRKYSVHTRTDTATVRSNHQRCPVRKGVRRNFANFTGKHLCQSLSSNKVPALRAATLFEKRDWYWCFLVSFPKFLTPFLQNNSGWLLMNCCFWLSQFLKSVRKR